MDLGIILKNNDLVVDSLTIAEVFGKEHRKVLRDIRKIQEDFSQTKIGSAEFSRHKIVPSDFEDYFYLETYKDKQGKKRPIYYMNQKGFTLLVMGYTGRKAFTYKVAYIEQFEQMKRALTDGVHLEEPTPLELVKIIRERLQNAYIIDQPKDEELGRDYYAVGIYGLLRYYGHDRNIPYDYIRSLRPKVMEIGLAGFEEIVNYCAVKNKLKLAYVKATAQDFQHSEVDQARTPIFGIFGTLETI